MTNNNIDYYTIVFINYMITIKLDKLKHILEMVSNPKSFPQIRPCIVAMIYICINFIWNVVVRIGNRIRAHPISTTRLNGIGWKMIK